MPARIDLTGQKFNRLTVISPAVSRNRHSYWLCRCDCGVEVEVRTQHLREEEIKSCGCLKVERDKERAKTLCEHRKVVRSTVPGAYATREYAVWRSMVQRCTNPNSNIWEYYGGRGIKVCQRWQDSFDDFLADIDGSIPKGLELDRIDNDGHYEPDNVRLVTRSENVKNRDYAAILAKRKRNELGQFK